jgi:hypothetical protein
MCNNETTSAYAILPGAIQPILLSVLQKSYRLAEPLAMWPLDRPLCRWRVPNWPNLYSLGPWRPWGFLSAT